MIDIKAKVVRNVALSSRTYMMELLAPQMIPLIRAGHFVMVKVSKTNDPSGRRAFAVGDVKDDSLFIFYDVVGKGTRLLSDLHGGDHVELFGPLGKGIFSLEGEKHLLIGGGIGLAGLTLLGKDLRKRGKRVLFVYGGKGKEHLSMKGWLEEEGFEHILYTEDGSLGRRGLVVDALKEFDSSWTISACGPRGMLKALKDLTGSQRLYISLESRMACGWGVCLGCVVKSREGHYVRVCYEGPVFRADEVCL
ncbi:MAG: dihydroorotate dehydrogenase electron transfer subunit [Hydrogenobacter sp.]|uniref:iron-sulfur cluster-binding protein n=1 Tax=Hydrogenobacter thermophilus TaxID=940 RepID=UPI0030F8BA9D